MPSVVALPGFDYVLPPILQCMSGQLICNHCCQKINCCPICRGPLGSIHSLAMEKLASSVRFPCKYASCGCTASLPHAEKPDHEELCEFQPCSHPSTQCSCEWQGPLGTVMPHLKHEHKSIKTLWGKNVSFQVRDISLPCPVSWMFMQSCYGLHFMLVLEQREHDDGHEHFFAFEQLLGTRKQAENFTYRVVLNGHRWQLTWEVIPRSFHEGIEAAIMDSDCLVFDTNTAQRFAENNKLVIKVTISKC